MKPTIELAPAVPSYIEKPQELRWWKAVDRLLRGEATGAAAAGPYGIPISSDRLQLAIVMLGMGYGLCMGVYGLMKGGPISLLQLLSLMVKVPALFLLTLVVTFPSLYVFNTLVGSRLSIVALWRLLTSSVALNMAVLASFGPIVAFFSMSTSSYSFMLLLNVIVFTISGALGLRFLMQTLQRLAVPQDVKPAVPPVVPDASEGQYRAEPYRRPQLRLVFSCWIIAFALVGAQMSWLLRPFLGSPDQPFSLFRSRDSNFFEAVWHHAKHLLGW